MPPERNTVGIVAKHTPVLVTWTTHYTPTEKLYHCYLRHRQTTHNDASHSHTEQSHRETLNVDRHHDGVRVRPRNEIVTRHMDDNDICPGSPRDGQETQHCRGVPVQRTRRTNLPPPHMSAAKRCGSGRYIEQ